MTGAGAPPADPAGRLVEQGRLLIIQGRFDLAERALARALELEPDDWQALGLHAIALADLKRFREALVDAQNGIHLAPDEGAAHYAHGYVLLRSDRKDEAERAAREAVRCKVDDAGYLGLLGSVLLRQRRWGVALDVFDRALTVSPEAGLLTSRSVALVHLGRLEEARADSQRGLEADPESSDGIAVAGYLALHDGRIAEAVDLLREALRIDPTNEFAKDWIREALRGQDRSYRLVQRYQLWDSRASRPKSVAAFGLLVTLRWIPGIGLLVWLFTYWSWVWGPVANLRLLRDPVGRLVLAREEVGQGLAVALLLVVGAVAIVLEILVRTGRWGLIGAASLLLAVPVAQLLRASPGWPRRVMIGFTSVAAVSALIGVLGTFVEAPPFNFESSATKAIVVEGLAVLVLTFVGNRIAEAEPAR